MNESALEGQQFQERRETMKAKEGVINILNKILTADLTAINQYFVHAKMCDSITKCGSAALTK